MTWWQTGFLWCAAHLGTDPLASPHVHFIVAGGALNGDGNWVYPKHKGKFLFQVRAVSKVFQGKFMRGLEQAINNNKFCLPEDQISPSHGWQSKRFLRSLVTRNWVVYCKSPFKKAEQVIKYIGRYTHKVALSSSRLVGMENGHVKFRYRDYKEQKKSKIMPLKVEDFLQRFVWHVLPDKFHRIRHYSFLVNGVALSSCKSIKRMLGTEEKLDKVVSVSPMITCKKCKLGIMILLKLITQSGHLITPLNRYGFDNST